MPLTSYLLAVALLAAPPDAMELPDGPWYAATAASLRTLALRWELMDHREADYVLANPEEFANDVKLLQGRFQDLGSAPLVVECKRFPDRGAIADLMAFNRSYREALTTRLALDKVHADEIQDSIEETDQLYRVWDLARDARCEYYYVTYRRQALQQLRELIGAEAFYTGQMPPSVPLWRIPIVD